MTEPLSIFTGTTRPRRIAIVASGRFHVLDLGRELAALGHSVRFYSFVPKRRATGFGLPAEASRSLLPLTAPFVAWDQLASGFLPSLREPLVNTALNRAAITRMEPCDVVVAMSGLANEAALYARRKYGALIFLERGSEHILIQRERLLADGMAGPSDLTVRRELDGYAFADRIVVPATNVAANFPAELQSRLFINRYGADLTMFPQREAPPSGPPTMVFAGGWTRRKGVDLMVPLLERIPELRLIHCGAVADEPLPFHPRFTSIGRVDQRSLGAHYRNADLLISPSREEGLPLVRIQALASGIPIVCSDDTGAQDMAVSPALAARIDALAIDDLDAMAAAIRRRIAERATWMPLPEADRELLSWTGYGRRYAERIEADLVAREAGLPLPALR
ncbi:MAG: glycosyltransferase family 4 protein [Sphingomicrobium sp.]